jgi:hypothetical protein
VLQSYRKISQTPIAESRLENYCIFVSVMGEDGLGRILEEAEIIVNDALAVSPQQPGTQSKTNLREKS